MSVEGSAPQGGTPQVRGQAGEQQPAPAARAPVDLGPQCPNCGEPWLRPTNLPGRYRCVYCLHRFELTSVCPNCGEHSTIVRMSSTAILKCNNCGDSMLQAV